MLDGNPDLASVLEFPRQYFRGISGWVRFSRWQRQLRQDRRFDLALDFQGLLRSALIGRLSRADDFYGMADAREGARWFYDHAAPMTLGIAHAVERYLALARYAVQQRGVKNESLMNETLRFPLPTGEPFDPETVTRLSDSFIVLHPFARGADKSLSKVQIEQFIARLAPRQVVLVGFGGQTMERRPPNLIDLSNRTSLPQLIWLLRLAAFVISVDSGPAHLAAALDRPMVAIHTWSDPRRVGPHRPDAWVWKSGQLTQVRNLATLDPSLFCAPPTPLDPAQIEVICALATSPSCSCA